MDENAKANEIEQCLRQWEETALRKTVARIPERKSDFQTASNIPLQRLYTPCDLRSFNYEDQLGFPGSYPFTRGIQSTMYRGRFWTMRQYSGFGSATETNKRFKYLLSLGQTGLSIAFDLPTQMGYDSDHPLAKGEVGRVGVAIDSLADMEALFDGIPLDQVSTSMTINAPAIIILAMYIVVAEQQKIPLSKLRGTIQNDILKEYIARGTYIFPLEPSMRLVTDLFQYCSEELPNWNTISISGYHIREAGSSAIQEVAFTIANAISYVEAAMSAGLDVNKFASRLSFFFGAHNDFFEEIAKFRAARRIWAKIVKNRFNVNDDNACRMRMHVQTAGCTLTAQQPDNNIIRVAYQALTSVLGGTQSLHTNSRDEALGLPSEDSVRIALRTQQILAHETGIPDTIDPLAGSYFVEHLTDAIEKEVELYLGKIQEMGGAVSAIKKGYMQTEIHESAYKYQKNVEAKQRIIVGVNSHICETSENIEFHRVNPLTEGEQCRRLSDIRQKRNSIKVTNSLNALREEAKKRANLVPPIIEAVRNYATLGEICDVLREVLGLYQPGDW